MKLVHRFDGNPGAPVLVLAGSLGSTLAMWDPQLPLAEHFRLLRYDHPGHGSSAPAEGPLSIADLGAGVIDLLDELGLDRVSWCGLSLGGMVGMWLAVNAPERVDRLVLCCTSSHLGPPAGWDERATLVRRAGMGAVADSVVRRWFTVEFLGDVEPYRAMLLATDAESYALCCEAIRDLDLRGDLSRITAPTLVVAGAEDPSAPVEHAETIARGITGSRLVVVPDAAHLANVEQPIVVNDAVLEHLAVTA
jgi:3-oxoadipate enol-lactonase